MLKQGYWLTEFLTISSILKGAPSRYARSFIFTEQDGGDLTYFFLYHLEVIVRAIGELDQYLARKVAELRDVRVMLAATPGEYNHRQLTLLELAMKDSTHVFTAQSHALSHNVSTETARHDLADLTSRGLLSQERVRRQFMWRPVPNLAETIRKNQSG
jgi:Fic family protein